MELCQNWIRISIGQTWLGMCVHIKISVDRNEFTSFLLILCCQIECYEMITTAIIENRLALYVIMWGNFLLWFLYFHVFHATSWQVVQHSNTKVFHGFFAHLFHFWNKYGNRRWKSHSEWLTIYLIDVCK